MKRQFFCCLCWKDAAAAVEMLIRTCLLSLMEDWAAAAGRIGQSKTDHLPPIRAVIYLLTLDGHIDFLRGLNPPFWWIAAPLLFWMPREIEASLWFFFLLLLVVERRKKKRRPWKSCSPVVFFFFLSLSPFYSFFFLRLPMINRPPGWMRIIRRAHEQSMTLSLPKSSKKDAQKIRKTLWEMPTHRFYHQNGPLIDLFFLPRSTLGNVKLVIVSLQRNRHTPLKQIRLCVCVELMCGAIKKGTCGALVYKLVR